MSGEELRALCVCGHPKGVHVWDDLGTNRPRHPPCRRHDGCRKFRAAPSTPEPSGLREALAAVVRKWSGHLSERMLDDLVRAAAPPTEPALDVERLAEAAHGLLDGEQAGWLAAEYVRLAEPQSDETTCGVLARCGRPMGHRGHHGGWRT